MTKSLNLVKSNMTRCIILLQDPICTQHTMLQSAWYVAFNPTCFQQVIYISKMTKCRRKKKDKNALLPTSGLFPLFIF